MYFVDYNGTFDHTFCAELGDLFDGGGVGGRGLAQLTEINIKLYYINVFYSPQLILQRGSNGLFQENHNCPRLQGVQHFQEWEGASKFCKVGVQFYFTPKLMPLILESSIYRLKRYILFDCFAMENNYNNNNNRWTCFNNYHWRNAGLKVFKWESVCKFTPKEGSLFQC